VIISRNESSEFRDSSFFSVDGSDEDELVIPTQETKRSKNHAARRSLRSRASSSSVNLRKARILDLLDGSEDELSFG